MTRKAKRCKMGNKRKARKEKKEGTVCEKPPQQIEKSPEVKSKKFKTESKSENGVSLAKPFETSGSDNWLMPFKEPSSSSPCASDSQKKENNLSHICKPCEVILYRLSPQEIASLSNTPEQNVKKALYTDPSSSKSNKKSKKHVHSNPTQAIASTSSAPQYDSSQKQSAPKALITEPSTSRNIYNMNSKVLLHRLSPQTIAALSNIQKHSPEKQNIQKIPRAYRCTVVLDDAARLPCSTEESLEETLRKRSTGRFKTIGANAGGGTHLAHPKVAQK